MAIVYEYSGREAFLDDYLIPSDKAREAASAIFAESADSPDYPLFKIVVRAEVDGWDIAREFSIRLPDTDTAERLAAAVDGDLLD